MPKAECRNNGCNASFEADSDSELIVLMARHYWLSAKQTRLSFGAIVPVHQCITFSLEGDRKHVISFDSGKWEERIKGGLVNIGRIPDECIF